MHAIWATGSATKQRAFTLLEIMVVVALLAMLSAAIPWSLSRFQPTKRVIAAADRLAADIRSLQIEAAASGQVARLELNDSGYVLRTGKDAEEIALPDTMSLSISTPTSEPQQSLSFYPDGSASGGTILLRDGRRTASLEISMLTGAIRSGASRAAS